MRRAFGVLLLLTWFSAAVAAQPSFDPGWYRAGGAVKIGVVQDGVYRVTGADLAAAGFGLSGVEASRLELVERGRVVPLLRLGGTGPTLAATDTLVFVGRRNRGAEEALWAYDAPGSQSSAFYSLYSDTTYYWLRLAPGTGRTYDPLPASVTARAPRATLRDTVHIEQDNVAYEGDSDNSGHPLYTRGEGSYWQAFSQVGAAPIEAVFPITLPGRASASDTLGVRVRLSGGSASRHRVQLLFEYASGFTPVADADWSGYSFRDLSAPALGTAIPAGERLNVRLLALNDFLGNPNVSYLDFLEVAYTRLTRAQNGQDRLPLGAGDQALSLTGYDPTGRIVALAPELGVGAVLSQTGGAATLSGRLAAASTVWTASTTRLLAPARLSVQAAPALATQGGADYVIVTTPALHASADALATYHRSQGLTALVVLQQDVFDQFEYGRPTPLALRRFVYSTQSWARPARFLTLWGDALPVSRTRPLAPWEVITYGSAPSDAWLAMQRGGPTDFTEVLAIGRLPIRSNADGALFVQKLQAYESSARGPWLRRALHVAGGLNDGERATLRSYQQLWEGIETRLPTAMDTTNLYKSSDLVVDGVYRERIRAEMQEGLSWYVFFGHSSPQIWEVLTDAPTEFNNAARLPVVLSLGCRTGVFTLGTATLDTRSLAEQLVIGSLNGGIAHWGASELSSISPSGSLSTEVHRLVFTDTLRVLGEAFREAKRRYATMVGAGGARYLLQYGLIGDPATRYRLPTAPDFHVEASDLAFNDEAPVASAGSLGLRVRLHNVGLVPADSVSLAIMHTAPGLAPVTYRRRIAALRDTATVRLTLPVQETGAGEHRVEVTIDDAHRYAEADETDNHAERRITVFASGLALAYPGPNGITGPTPTLAWRRSRPHPNRCRSVSSSTRRARSPPRRAWNTSPPAAPWPRGPCPDDSQKARRTSGARAPKGLPRAPGPPAASPCVSDLAEGALLQGATLAASLTAQNVSLDGGGQWRFQTDALPIEVTAERGGGELKGQITVGTQTYLPVTLGWGVVVLDGNTGQVRHAESYATYAMDPSLETRFNTTESKARRRLDSLTATVRPGDYVLARSRFLGNLSGPTINAAERASLRRLGSTAIDTLDYGDLWLMLTRAGDPSVHLERVISPGGTNEIVVDTSLAVRVQQATLTSTPIGPVRAWGQAEVRVALSGGASAFVDVLGADGAVLLGPQPVNTAFSLSSLDARTVSTIRLRTTITDPARTTTPQLQRITVAYVPIPDVALDPAGLTLSAASLIEGQALRMTVPVVSLANQGLTDVLVQTYVTDANNRETLAGTDTVRALAPGVPRTVTRDVPTKGLVGRNRLRVVASQIGLTEPVVTNNTLLRSFTVTRDATPPRFTIRIDGESFPADPDPVRNLRDARYPFVSAHPAIEIVVRDDGAVLPIADTTAFTLTLDGRRIRLSSPAVQFVPATGAQPDARLVFTPDLSAADTTHTLTLRVFDASKNEAAGSPYQVHFRVSREAAVEQVLPYPNPMHDRTTFAFRLRGDDAAAVEEFRLRIFSLTGVLVREFDLVRDPSPLASGALRIGWNRLRWDGTDADGDAVATGVYLYRVSVRARGSAVAVEDGARVERLVVIR